MPPTSDGEGWHITTAGTDTNAINLPHNITNDAEEQAERQMVELERQLLREERTGIIEEAEMLREARRIEERFSVPVPDIVTMDEAPIEERPRTNRNMLNEYYTRTQREDMSRGELADVGFDVFLDVGEGECVEFLQMTGFGGREINRLLDDYRKEGCKDKDSLESKVRRYLKGETVEGITDETVEEYYQQEKKRRFIGRGERQRLHKPQSDGKKPTSSVKLDDIVAKVK
jgi:hypothetical protein